MLAAVPPPRTLGSSAGWGGEFAHIGTTSTLRCPRCPFSCCVFQATVSCAEATGGGLYSSLRLVYLFFLEQLLSRHSLHNCISILRLQLFVGGGGGWGLWWSASNLVVCCLDSLYPHVCRYPLQNHIGVLWQCLETLDICMSIYIGQSPMHPLMSYYKIIWLYTHINATKMFPCISTIISRYSSGPISLVIFS